MFKVEPEFAADEAEVSVSFCAWHYFGGKDVPEVFLAHHDVVDQVLMLGPGIHPCSLQAVFLPKNRV